MITKEEFYIKKDRFIQLLDSKGFYVDGNTIRVLNQNGDCISDLLNQLGWLHTKESNGLNQWDCYTDKERELEVSFLTKEDWERESKRKFDSFKEQGFTYEEIFNSQGGSILNLIYN